MKEVKRHAKVGEYIKIVDPTDMVGHGYEIGDIFNVIDDDDGFRFVYGVSERYNCGDNGWCLGDSEYVVLEGYHEVKQTTLVLDKINIEGIVVPKPNLEMINDVVKNLQNNLSFDFKIDTNKLHNIAGADGLCLYYDELINEEREEKDMNKVLKLYEERKLKEIDEKYEKKVGDDYNEIELVKQYNELVMNFESKLEELFNSLDNFDNGYLVTQCDSNCYKCTLSEDMIKNKLASKYFEEKQREIDEVTKLVSEADAQLSLSDDLNYQIEVLSRYEIIDNKTNKMKV